MPKKQVQKQEGKVYVAVGEPKSRTKDPKKYHSKMKDADGKGEPHPHKKRWICFVQGCAWGANTRKSEVSPHFKAGAHPGAAYDISKVLTIKWKNWLKDEDLVKCAKATTQEELNAEFSDNESSDEDTDAEGETDDEVST